MGLEEGACLYESVVGCQLLPKINEANVMTTNDIDSLTHLRSELRDLDTEILKLVAKRLELSREVGEYKLRMNIPIKDYQVEKQVIERAREKARELDVYPALAETIAKTLIHYSVLKQDELTKSRYRADEKIAGKRVLIVGGLGLMGRWLAGFFESFGHLVSINDIREPQEKHGDFIFEKDLGHGCRDADIILLATPLAATGQVLQQIIDFKPRGIVVEISSLKSPIIPVIESGQKQGVRIASIHPMFGPDVETLAGRNILLCETGDFEALGVIEAIWRMTSANLIRLPLGRHDALMSHVLGAAHFYNLIYAGALERSNIPLAELERVGGTTFQNQIEVTRAVARENQDLYYEIQSLNSHTAAMLQKQLEVFEDYRRAIANCDREAFKSLMEKNRQYFDAT